MDNNIVDLSSKRKDPEMVKLVNLGNEIDKVILHYVNIGCDPKEITIIVGHRLSELLRHLGDDKEAVWETVSDIILERLRNG